MTSEIAYIALGSNLGDRRAHLDFALDALRAHPGVQIVAVSRVIETEPVGPPNQGRYLNAAAAVRTRLEPRDLLELCLSIERARGRARTEEGAWGPRTLDLDLLLHGSRVIDEPGLAIPHPRLHERLFVLEPLAEIAGGTAHPTLGVTIEALRQGLMSRCGD
jgi:2-amino-4-hydroxy-6-hydroxymethyldihydropteridine diphosphokinase